MLGASVAHAAPASAHGDKEQREEIRLAGLSQVDGTPILSDNVEHLANIPGQVGISGCFMQTDELFVTSGLESVRVYDVSDGTNPTEVGVLASAVFENEAMNCGERVIDGERQRFALIGVDLYQASPGDPQHVNQGDGQELVNMDVVPIYENERQIQRKSDIAYSIDLVRGLDVYRVDVGDDGATSRSMGADRSVSSRTSAAALPLGVVGGALALALAVRRRNRDA